MKKLIIGIITGVILSVSLTVFASENQTAALFPCRIVFHSDENSNILDNSKIQVLNYENRIYIPLRAFAEAIGATVNYQDGNSAEERRIDVFR